MRGNPKNQSGQIFRKLDRIGTSRHAAKTRVKSAGISGNHNVSQHIGIHSYSTMTLYRRIGTEFLTWCRDVHGVKDAAKLQPDHVEEWLQIKVASGVRYKTFATYGAALGKMSAGLREIYNREYDWTPVIDETRLQARQYCDSDVKSRGYQRPEAIIEHLSGVYKLASTMQFLGGARVREITVIRPDQLLGNDTIMLTNTKGGRRREMELPAELYRQVAGIVQSHGEFRFKYQNYLRSLKAACMESGQKYMGSHGLRWSYAQKVVREAQENGLGYDEALKEVSERMGHSRAQITEYYLQ